MKSDGNTHRLIIPEVLPEDTGEFVCEAYNDWGDTDTFCFLHVRGRDPQASNGGHCHRNVLGVPHVQHCMNYSFCDRLIATEILFYFFVSMHIKKSSISEYDLDLMIYISKQKNFFKM